MVAEHDMLGSSLLRKLLLLFSASYLFALVEARATLRFPWFWDDYHLIRRFSADELRRAFTGPWDLDGIESISYRPLWVVANHVRAVVLGENVLLQRLFLLAVLALFTALIVLSVHRMGLRLHYALFAALFALSTKSNHANLIWLTDATHALSGIPVALCALSCSTGKWSHPKLHLLAISLLSFIGLLVREDIAALFPFVLAVGICSRHEAREELLQPSQLLRLLQTQLPTACALAASLSMYFWLRRTYVPEAVTGFRIEGFLSHVFMVATPFGTLLSRNHVLAFHIFVGTLLCGALIADRSALRHAALLILACVLLGCSPGLVTERSNLLMVPATLFACLLLLGVQAILDRTDARLLSGAVLLVGLWFSRLSYQETRTALLSGHPRSTQTIQYAADFLYGPYASRATIPAQRRAKAEKYLRRFGIQSADTYAVAFPIIVADANGRAKRPGRDRKPFVPPSLFLDH